MGWDVKIPSFSFYRHPMTYDPYEHALESDILIPERFFFTEYQCSRELRT